jgi:hypothetical protein
MKIICVEEHAIDPATDKAARPAVLDEAPYFGLMDSPNAASRLNDLSVPLYAHPGIPPPDVQQAYYTGFPPEVTAQFSLTGWGWHHEAGIYVLRLILSRTFGKYPGLQVISGHWGEMVPFYRDLPEPCVGHPQRPVRPSPLPVHPHRHRRRPHHLVGRLPVPHAGRHQGIPRETPGQRTRPGKDRALERRETVHAVR